MKSETAENVVEEEKPEKRTPVDKQTAFVEFKGTAEGMQLDEKIGGLKQTGKDRRSSIKNVTEDLNKIKK